MGVPLENHLPRRSPHGGVPSGAWGRPSRGAISCTRCAFVMAVRAQERRGQQAQRVRWRPPRAWRRAACAGRPWPADGRGLRTSETGRRPRVPPPAVSPSPKSRRLDRVQRPPRAYGVGGSFALRGGSAPAALAPLSPRYSMSMAREAVRASESLVQARLPRSWTTVVLAQQRRPMGRTASRASDAIERPMPTQSRQMPMSLRRVGTGWRAGWMQSADRWRGRGWPRSAWDGPKLACSPGLYADGRSNVGNGALRGRLRRRKWRSWAVVQGLQGPRAWLSTCDYSARGRFYAGFRATLHKLHYQTLRVCRTVCTARMCIVIT